MNRELTYKIVSKLLDDKSNNVPRQDLPEVICFLLQPFVKSKKLSKNTETSLNNIIHSYGICSRCHNEHLKKSTDLYCKYCKSVLKEQAKKVIE